MAEEQKVDVVAMVDAFFSHASVLFYMSCGVCIAVFMLMSFVSQMIGLTLYAAYWAGSLYAICVIYTVPKGGLDAREPLVVGPPALPAMLAETAQPDFDGYHKLGENTA